MLHDCSYACTCLCQADVAFVRDNPYSGDRCAPPQITTEKWKMDGTQQTENHRNLYNTEWTSSDHPDGQQCQQGFVQWKTGTEKRGRRNGASRAIPRPEVVSCRSRTKISVGRQMRPSITTCRGKQQLRIPSRFGFSMMVAIYPASTKCYDCGGFFLAASASAAVRAVMSC